MAAIVGEIRFICITPRSGNKNYWSGFTADIELYIILDA